jgi:hypothetical protein
MGGKMRYVFRRHLFLLIGLLTLCLFHLVEALNRAGKREIAEALAGPMRVLVVPMYLVWMLLTMAQVAIAGPRGLPAPFGAIVSIIGLVAGLGPYALLDYVLNPPRCHSSKLIRSVLSLRDSTNRTHGCLRNSGGIFLGVVTDVAEVFRLGTAKVEENLAFRRYLSAHHYPDEPFQILASEVQQHVDCTSCGNCCRHSVVSVNKSEIEQIAGYIGTTPDVRSIIKCD